VNAIEHGSSRPGRWLEHRRTRIALWIAALESLVVALSRDITKWTVLVVAVVAILAWIAVRDNRSTTLRGVLWILAVSQLLTVIAVILAVIFKWAAIMAVVVFAVLGLVYLYLDRR
jgi:hypothetical protein